MLFQCWQSHCFFLAGCLKVEPTNEVPDAKEEIRATTTKSSYVLTEPLSVTSGPSSPPVETQVPIDYERIAYLQVGVPSITSLNGGAIIIDITGRVLSEIDLDCLFCNSLSWSPDGQWFAYSAHSDLSDVPDIYITKVDGSQTKRITHSAAPIIDISWSPDGKRIAFIGKTDNASNSATIKNWGLYVMNADGNDIAPIKSDGKGQHLFLAWAPVPTLQIGETYIISALGANLNLRESASLTSNILDKLVLQRKVRGKNG